MQDINIAKFYYENEESETS